MIRDAAAGRWLQFRQPRRVIETCHIDEVIPKLRLVERAVQERGRYAAGFISYEAAPAFDSALHVRPQSSFPLVWFGIHGQPEVIDLPVHPPRPAHAALHWAPSVSRAEYDRAIAQIKTHIARGETYQVNYTFRLRTPFTSAAWTFFLELVRAQQAEYAAYVDTGRFTVCSASPELFFALDGRRLISRPMKGTAARGLTFAEDREQSEWLRRSEKNRAENVMIVDMVRNDMGRVAEIGSVQVPDLFSVEQYPTLWQMTSTVTATTEASVVDIMAALFPCASITGAPKPRTTQIISALESTPRRVYTGCIGFIAPNRQAQFNVAIRTVLLDRVEDQAEYGVGGGIVWDSSDRDEYAECLVKARVLTERWPEFSLLETMLWTPDDGYFLLPYHLRRLHDSAAYFGFPAALNRIEARLMDLSTSLPPTRHKVRLLVAQDGGIKCRATPLPTGREPGPVRLRIAPSPLRSDDPFLYHKTTHRQVYDAAREACTDCDDVLLWNERDEVTESSTANVVVELEGEQLTPPVSCGLLPGTFRAWLLDQGTVREEIVTMDTLRRADKTYVVNSVRKWRRAILKW